MSTNARAERSLGLGISSLGLMFFTGVPAIILGVLALRDIRKSAGALDGASRALAGIATGLVGTCFGVALTLFVADRLLEASARTQ
jgi:hypothetical protein